MKKSCILFFILGMSFIMADMSLDINPDTQKFLSHVQVEFTQLFPKSTFTENDIIYVLLGLENLKKKYDIANLSNESKNILKVYWHEKLAILLKKSSLEILESEVGRVEDVIEKTIAFFAKICTYIRSNKESILNLTKIKIQTKNQFKKLKGIQRMLVNLKKSFVTT